MLPKPESTCLNPHQVMDAGRSWGPSRFDKVYLHMARKNIHHSPGYVKARIAKSECLIPMIISHKSWDIGWIYSLADLSQ